MKYLSIWKEDVNSKLAESAEATWLFDLAKTWEYYKASQMKKNPVKDK